MHGNLIQVFKKGVLILGAARSGKSSLCWELLSKNPNHQLISDDMVQIEHHNHNPLGTLPNTKQAGKLFIYPNIWIHLPPEKWISQYPIHQIAYFQNPPDFLPHLFQFKIPLNWEIDRITRLIEKNSYIKI